MKYELLVLFCGWVLRCVALLKDLDRDILSNAAGLFFFTACCIALAHLLKTFHSQRDCPGSRYRSLKMILWGYIVFFTVVEVCMTVAFLVEEPASSGTEAVETTDMLESVLSALFAISFLFISITFFVVFFMLKDAWSYLKAVIPFCLFLSSQCLVCSLSCVLTLNRYRFGFVLVVPFCNKLPECFH